MKDVEELILKLAEIVNDNRRLREENEHLKEELIKSRE